MYCDILDSFYLKPNGQVPCEDDIGEAVTLGVIENAGDWSPDRFFASPKYLELRAAHQAGRLPWGEMCRKCAQLQPRTFKAGLLRRRIRKLQIEPSMLCALRCPACGNLDQLKVRNGERLMPLDLFERVLAGFRREGYSIDFVEYAGQGEPLQHPEFASLAALMRRYFPRTLQRVITNGNHDFRDVLGGEQVEHLVVSCDGARQDGYEKYRRRGDIGRVFRFMEDARRFSPRTRVIWKYILFEFNDSDAEILLAQQIARRIGVQEMRFVVTGTIHRSRRFHHGNMHELPQARAGISVRLNPLLSRADQVAELIGRRGWSRWTGADRGPRRGSCSPSLAGGFGRVFTTFDGDRRILVIEAWVAYLFRTAAGGKFVLLVDGAALGEVPVPAAAIRAARSLAWLGWRHCRLRYSVTLEQPLPDAIRVAIRESDGGRHWPVLEGRFAVTSVD